MSKLCWEFETVLTSNEIREFISKNDGDPPPNPHHDFMIDEEVAADVDSEDDGEDDVCV